MPAMTAQQTLDRHFLEIRCGLLDVAAALDRVERSGGAREALVDPRMQDIRQAIEILGSEGDDRAERLQLLFSDPYQPGWNRR
jgi:hypothetical protein